MNWTIEQRNAIEKSGNIIVSAGAGSGKTAVLTERVIEKLKKGVSINELIILTFTNAAASEMKERIKSKIKGIRELKNQLNLIDSSYITTFDSFALSMLKKYNYVLNLPKNISIIDNILLKMQKEKILNEIFEEYYSNEKFKNFIDTFTTKDDNKIKVIIDNYYDKLNTIENKDKYLEEYVNKYYEPKFIDNMFNKYVSLIVETKNNMLEELNNMKAIATDQTIINFINETETILSKFNNGYRDFQELAKMKFTFPRKYDEVNIDVIKEAYEKFKNYKKQIEEYTKTEEKQLIEEVLLTKENVSLIIDILKEYDKRIMSYKLSLNSFEFSDIMIFAIKIFSENEEIKAQTKLYYNEIMIDEYQDTSDIQEYLISLISNNNLYVVGDIKQSIYRFRNANPNIFKTTYQKFSETGLCIDLNKNFRSRSEVIENINLIFQNTMDEIYGGVNYDTKQKLIAGNLEYDLNNLANMEIFNYDYDKEYSREEIEAFIIADDIMSKVNNYEVYDKKTKSIRKAKYSDFCILVDRKTNFDLFKKIFEFKKIPLNVFKDEKFIATNEIYAVRSILQLISMSKEKDYTELKHTFLSLARSYILEIPDDIIYKNIDNILTCKEFKNIFDKINKLEEYANKHSLSGLMNKIYEEFDIYNKSILIGDVDLRNTKLSYLIETCRNLDNSGTTLKEFVEYFDYMIKNEVDISFNTVKDFSKNAVNIMSIHGSKGLEFNICYFPMLYKKFNIEDIKDSFLFDKEIGIIVPNFIEGIKDTFYKTLMKENYTKEEISEKIRLFYVALTRSKEKMIFIADIEEKHVRKSEYRSFLDILLSIKSLINPYTVAKEFIVNKNYKLLKNNDYKKYLTKTNKKYEYEDISIEKKLIEREVYSNKNTMEINNDLLEEGVLLHEVLEYLDFKNYAEDLKKYDIKEIYKNKIIELFKQPFMENIDKANIYKELSINEGSGVIDLVIETDKVIVVDYKLKEIDKVEYKTQVEKYIDYLSEKTAKKVEGYIYSILECRYIKI